MGTAGCKKSGSAAGSDEPNVGWNRGQGRAHPQPLKRPDPLALSTSYVATGRREMLLFQSFFGFAVRRVCRINPLTGQEEPT